MSGLIDQYLSGGHLRRKIIAAYTIGVSCNAEVKEEGDEKEDFASEHGHGVLYYF